MTTRTFAEIEAEAQAAVKDCITFVPGTKGGFLVEELCGSDYINNTSTKLVQYEDGEVETVYMGREVSLADIEAKFEKCHRKSAHQDEKAAKAARAEKYRAQLEVAGEFDYDVDEHKLYDAQVRFVKRAVESGYISEEDLLADD